MEILSSAQHSAFRAGKIPVPEEFAEGTWAVPMKLPGQFPGGSQSYSFAYVIDDFSGGLHVIDPGWDLPENIHRWDEFLSGIGRHFAHIATITATHLHRDHIGLAGEIRARSGASIVAHEAEARTIEEVRTANANGDRDAATRLRRAYTAMTSEVLREYGVPSERWEELQTGQPDFELPAPQEQVKDGEHLPVPGRDLRVVWTPGHTGGHMCLVEEATEVVFTADHVLPGINSGLGLGGESPTNPIADYLEALERIAQYDSFEAAPGHEYRFRGLAARANALREHHLRRSREVEAAMASSSAIWEIAAQVTWSDGFENLRSYKLGSALSQVAMHIEFVTGSRHG